jgi:hypothetical protein
VGGLEALFMCVRKLESSNEKCIYVNDGKPLIAQRAGQQLHEHPTQYPDYTVSHLVKKLLEKLYLAPKENPETYDYSPLHYSLSPLFSEPITFVSTYLGMFFATLTHKSKHGDRVSPDDQALVDLIRQSLEYMKKVNDDMQKTTGKSIMTQNGRLYWSIDADLLKHKYQHWKAMGISCSMVEADEIKGMTLLNADKHKMFALKMHKDGEIHPDIVENIIQYLNVKYKSRFEHKIASLSEVSMEKDVTHQIVLKTFEKEEKRSVGSLYSSLGHNSVYKAGKKAYHVIPVSGITTDWEVSMSKSDFEKRIKNGQKVETYLKECRVTPCADMFNLHVKILDHTIQGDKLNFFVRVTEGANVYSDVAEKRDMINIAWKLNEFFVGDWKLITAGSCTRKTGVVNRPEAWKGFHFGQSGVGISCSAGVWDDFFKK